MTITPFVPERLEEIAGEFQAADKADKLQLLMRFAEQFPPLPERYQGQENPTMRVHECMTPVYIYAELEGEHVNFFFSVPPESPTIRGYAAILAFILEGLTPQEVLRIPLDFYESLGLHKALSPQRIYGIVGMFSHVRKLAQKAQEIKVASS